MRIVHIANFYGPNSGGIKTTLHELGRGYKKLGHEFFYIVPGSMYLREETPYGIKLSLPSFILPGSGGYRIIKSNRLLKSEISALLPDRIEISDRFTLLSIGPWARIRNIPTVVFSHETLMGLAERFLPKYLPRRTLVKWHNRKLSKNFDQVIATTDFAAKEFREIERKNIVKVPLGVDLEIFQPSNRSEELRSELLHGADLLLVHCGRLSPEKEPQTSIEALRELLSMGIRARLVIVGTGPMWHRMRKEAAGLPVEFLGYVADRKNVAAILSSADISLAPGPLETFCLSALESLASGTPVVASSKSAVGEFLRLSTENPAGAVAGNTGAEFAEAIFRIMNRMELRTSARAVAEALPWDKSITRMLDIHGIEHIGKMAPVASTKRKFTAA
ncbi:MAG: glycosyltransferase [Actinomycetes bacterium]